MNKNAHSWTRNQVLKIKSVNLDRFDKVDFLE
jgi:hypothetical protein